MANQETQELVAALLSRQSVAEDAKNAFRKFYPDASDAMLDTAVLHVCVDGIKAAMDWLGAIEKFLRDPSTGLDYSATWHLNYHLYNWLQFQALMPLGRIGLSEHLADVEYFLKENEPNSALEVVHRLIDHLKGDVRTPTIA